MAQKFYGYKFSSLPLNYFDKKFMDINFTEALFHVECNVIFSFHTYSRLWLRTALHQ